jgi:hypothetical protein
MHPITVLQAALVSGWRNDPALAAIVGTAVFDAPPKGANGSMVVIARHDVVQRDADLVAAQEHRLLVHCWSDQPSRRRVADMAERVVAVALGCAVPGLTTTVRTHLRTDTAVDRDTGRARAAVTLRFLSE